MFAREDYFFSERIIWCTQQPTERIISCPRGLFVVLRGLFVAGGGFVVLPTQPRGLFVARGLFFVREDYLLSERIVCRHTVLTTVINIIMIDYVGIAVQVDPSFVKPN